MWLCLFVITSVLWAWGRRDQRRWLSCSCSGKSELWPVIETRMVFVVSFKASHKHSSFLHKLAFPLYLTIHSYVFPVVQYIVGHLFACLHAAAIIVLPFFVEFQGVPEVLAVHREVNCNCYFTKCKLRKKKIQTGQFCRKKARPPESCFPVLTPRPQPGTT